MKASPSVSLFSVIARPIATAAVTFLAVSGATMSPRAIAQIAPQRSVAAIETSMDFEKPAKTATSTINLPQVRAFLDVISWAETGTIDDRSYQTLVFKGFFNNFSTHPKVKQCAPISGRRVCSTAAGRYQMMGFNWDKLAPKLGLKDFSPESQDKMALYFIQQKGAMPDLLAGRFEKAACKVGGIWASFPCNNYGQHPKSMGKLKQFYQQRLSLYGNASESYFITR
ncbi:MAG: glycoside hydrolase family 104 protein [Aphanothece sp. CMT-3BRIN-NPC111]|jgi:muramidase (phage lysozyme)|nr:glycoside hydrolase family 104 protein [Aphanothece sp. CMT-3BRIN-NPC111]